MLWSGGVVVEVLGYCGIVVFSMMVLWSGSVVVWWSGGVVV